MWGTTTVAACAGVTSGYNSRISPTATTPPTTWAPTKLGTDEGAIPAKVLENIRPTVMAGLAKLVELVNQ